MQMTTGSVAQDSLRNEPEGTLAAVHCNDAEAGETVLNLVGTSVTN